MNDYVTLARPRYWLKNVFVLPGVVAAALFGLGPITWYDLVSALIATSLVSSANYVINGWLDALSDAHHPYKHGRPAVLGKVGAPGVVLEYLVLAAGGLGLGWWVSPLVFGALLAMLVMGAAYNVPPLRLKDHAYIDVVSESVNDALRLLIGWLSVTHTFLPPVSLVFGYWMGGAFLMTVKRLSEYRVFESRQSAARYRSSFGHYTMERLTVLALMFAMAASFFLGVFLVRYRYEYLLAMPVIWSLFGWCLALGLRQVPISRESELSWRGFPLLAPAVLVIGLIVVLTFVDIPLLQSLSDTSLVSVRVLGIGR